MCTYFVYACKIAYARLLNAYIYNNITTYLQVLYTHNMFIF